MKKKQILIWSILLYLGVSFTGQLQAQQKLTAEDVNRFHNEKNIDKKIQMYRQLEKRPSFYTDDKIRYTAFLCPIIHFYRQQSNWDQAIEWFSKYTPEDRILYAISLSDELLANNMGAKACELIAPLVPKPVIDDALSATGIDQLQIKYGKALFSQKEYEKAILYLAPRDFARLFLYENDDSAPTYYAMALAGADKPEALSALRKILSTGAATDSLKAVAQRYFVKKKGNDIEYRQIIDSVRTVTIQNLKSQMVNQPVKDFSLKDLNGKTVSLSDFKGKVVVLDFWATWCQPCINALPAMLQAANHYANDPNVVFLFIHTWNEKKLTPEQVRQEIIDFQKASKYAFSVLIDLGDATHPSAVAEDFAFKSIPAKFVIDGNGKIRFNHEVKSGTSAALTENIKIMIELAKKE